MILVYLPIQGTHAARDSCNRPNAVFIESSADIDDRQLIGYIKGADGYGAVAVISALKCKAQETNRYA